MDWPRRPTCPGNPHWHEWVDVEYLEQFTTEKAIRKYVKDRGGVREWVKLRECNETLDLEVHALTALRIGEPLLMRSLAERAAGWAQPVTDAKASVAPASGPIGPLAALNRNRRNWVLGRQGEAL